MHHTQLPLDCVINYIHQKKILKLITLYPLSVCAILDNDDGYIEELYYLYIVINYIN